jgi:hypothetical protein
MRVYFFRSLVALTLSAFTIDEAGANLPSDVQPWALCGASAAHELLPSFVREALTEDGFYLARDV